MNIEIIMISELELSGGGRETWLNNFLTGLNQYYNNIDSIEIHSLILSEDNLLKERGESIISKTYKKNFLFFPILISFIFRYTLNNFYKKKYTNKYIAVGGLDEMLALLIGNLFFVKKNQRVVWLRSIYSKEKATHYPKWLVKLLLFVEIFILRNFFGKIIANGYDTAKFYKKYDLNVDVIPNSIFIEDWTKSHKEEFNDVLNVAYIGRLTKVKGFGTFINCIKKINDNRILFHIIGEGDERKIIPNKENVKYYGPLSNKVLPEVVKKFDICVALTVFEEDIGGAGISNALLEHMASKKIIICWDNQIFRQILDEDTAYFVKQNDVEQLKRTIQYIFNNREEAMRKAHLSYIKVLTYSMENHIKLFNDLIKEV